jgi:hypothetical protein
MLNEKAFLFLSPDPPEGGNGGDPPETPPKGDPPADQPAKKDPPAAVPYDRFKEVNDRAKAAEEKLKAKEKAEEEAKLKKLEADGELKQVNEELSRKLAELQPKAESFDKLEQGIRSESLKQIADAIGDDKAADYANFTTEALQTVAKTFVKQAAPPAPDGSRPTGRNVDETEKAALQKYGSKANIARLNRDLYRKLYPNPRRAQG